MKIYDDILSCHGNNHIVVIKLFDYGADTHDFT